MTDLRPANAANSTCPMCRLARWGVMICLALLLGIWLVGWAAAAP